MISWAKSIIFFLLMVFLSIKGWASGETDNVDKFFPAPISDSSFFGPYWIESQFHIKDENYYEKNYYDLEKLKNHVLTKDFDVQTEMINLRQSRLNVYSKFGRILPRLNLQFNISRDTPVNFGALITGFFEFLFPDNWFNFMKARQLYKAQRYVMADLLLDRSLLTQVTYFQIHRVKWYYSLHILFYQYILDFLRDFKESHGGEDEQEGPIRYMSSFANNTYLRAIDLRQEIHSLLPDYAYLVNVEGVNAESHFDILRIPFPKNFEKFKKIKARHYIDKARENSLMLKALDHLKKAAQFQVGATSTNFVSADVIGLGINFGADNLINPFIEAGEVQKIDIKIKEQYAKIERNMVLATNLYNLSLNRYCYTKASLQKAKENLEFMLRKSIDSGNLNINIHHSIDFLLKNYVSLADAYHDFWIASISIKRLLVTPLLKNIEEHLPSDREVKHALKKVSDAEFVNTENKKRKKKKMGR